MKGATYLASENLLRSTSSSGAVMRSISCPMSVWKVFGGLVGVKERRSGTCFDFRAMETYWRTTDRSYSQDTYLDSFAQNDLGSRDLFLLLLAEHIPEWGQSRRHVKPSSCSKIGRCKRRYDRIESLKRVRVIRCQE